ncbi:MAG: GerMN domain-containing protein, partial [Anaerolineae bacterium]|nr:GerMN domain-containing protein [Anaerolineae bacterium]
SPGTVDGFTSAIPSPAGVLSYPGRDAAWGERVSLRQLTITNGVARADFSIELNAHAGGAEQVVHIRQQIEATLRQFATVNSVIITVNGQPALLEP